MHSPWRCGAYEIYILVYYYIFYIHAYRWEERDRINTMLTAFWDLNFAVCFFFLVYKTLII